MTVVLQRMWRTAPFAEPCGVGGHMTFMDNPLLFLATPIDHGLMFYLTYTDHHRTTCISGIN